MDAAVNGMWLAYYWARLDQNAEVIGQLEELILNWPFDVQPVLPDPNAKDQDLELERNCSLPG